jgi:hypothetical protein
MSGVSSTYVQTNENGVGWVEPCAYPILWICPHARLYIIFNSIFWCSSSFVYVVVGLQALAKISFSSVIWLVY